ncbi:hypothetical protein A2U01_0014285, partial [Trifolium medium]|nr:hypothetical protein [Trifolium medium]
IALIQSVNDISCIKLDHRVAEPIQFHPIERNRQNLGANLGAINHNPSHHLSINTSTVPDYWRKSVSTAALSP